VKQYKRIKLYHILTNEAHQSFVMNSNEYPPKTIEDLCQVVSGDKTGQRDFKTSITFFTSGSTIRCHDSKSKSNELGLLFRRRDLPHIQGSHIGVH
jgi:predicted transcriptional regulator